MGFGNSPRVVADIKDAAAKANERYEQGYRDGEANHAADWAFALGEAVDLPADQEAVLWGPQEAAAYIAALQASIRALAAPSAATGPPRCARMLLVMDSNGDVVTLRCRRPAGHPTADTADTAPGPNLLHLTDPYEPHPEAAAIVAFTDNAKGTTWAYDGTDDG